MNIRTYRRALLLCFLLFIVHCAVFAAIPSAPVKDIYLADFAGMVEQEDRKQILDIGKELDRQYGAQIVVVTVDSLDGQDIESYANTLFRTWGIGNKEKNNGVLLLIAKNDRKFRIEVGYGLEGAITDGYAGSVLDSMKRDFKEERYSAGIVGAYGKLTEKVYGEYGAPVPEGVTAAKERSEELEWWEMLLGIPIGLFLMGLLFWCLWRMVKLILFTIVMLLNLLSSGKIDIPLEKYLGRVGGGIGGYIGGSGGYSGSSGGGSSSSSSGGSYGGGRSGGGGASGGW